MAKKPIIAPVINDQRLEPSISPVEYVPTGSGSWWDYTFNPWWGCTKISAACTNCYAELVDAAKGPYRARQTGQPEVRHWGDAAPRLYQSNAYWAKPAAWNRKAEKLGWQRHVFCGSMCDVFEDRPGLVGERARLFETIQATPSLDWLLLTKRPENFAAMLPWARSGQPFGNVWLGVTAENQECADERIPLLLEVPAVLHFISYEPALGPLNLSGYLGENGRRGLAWVIAGNEDAARARARVTDLAWLRDVRDQCASAGVLFHLKQWAGPRVPGIRGIRDARGKMHLPMLDGQSHGISPRHPLR